MVDGRAAEYTGRTQFAQVDVTANPMSAGKYGVRSMPTLLIFKNGEPVGQVVGAVPKNVLEARLKESIA